MITSLSYSLQPLALVIVKLDYNKFLRIIVVNARAAVILPKRLQLFWNYIYNYIPSWHI